MPVLTSYPGVYVEEIPSGVHNIAGVSTASTAFIDYFSQGPMGVATQINNFTQFQTVFGGLNQLSEASYGVMQYFLNGGQTAWIVRVAAGSPAPAQLTLDDTENPAKATLTITASSSGVWGTNLQVGVDTKTVPSGLFNLVIRRVDSISNPAQVLNTEIYRNLSMTSSSPNYAIGVVNAASALVTLSDLGVGTIPATTNADVISPISNPANAAYVSVNTASSPANDGSVPDANALVGGLPALDRLDPYIFNILCIPAAANLVSGGKPDTTNIATVYTKAAAFCDTKRAFLLVDIRSGINLTSSTASTGVVDYLIAFETAGFTPDANSAIYFPRLLVSDPLNQGRQRNCAASGTIAGIYATTDANRGVWKSPAGIDATIAGASMAYIMNDADSGTINPLGINGLRNFKTCGNVVWGARTMQGADQFASGPIFLCAAPHCTSRRVCSRD